MCNLQYVFFECSTEVLQANHWTPKNEFIQNLNLVTTTNPWKKPNIHTGFFVSRRFTVRRFRVMPASCKNSAKNWPPWHRIWRQTWGPVFVQKPKQDGAPEAYYLAPLTQPIFNGCLVISNHFLCNDLESSNWNQHKKTRCLEFHSFYPFTTMVFHRLEPGVISLPYN